MSKFWTVVTILAITALVFLAVEKQGNEGISFTDLETECRYDMDKSTSIGLDGDKITFSGYFQTNSPEANLNYRYTKSGSDIELDIVTSDSMIPDSFYDSCLASAVYEAETRPLESGEYTVTVYHDGIKQKDVGIRVK